MEKLNGSGLEKRMFVTFAPSETLIVRNSLIASQIRSIGGMLFIRDFGSPFPSIPYWIIPVSIVSKWWEQGFLGTTTKISRNRALKLLRGE
jgi:hypothetical protein